MSDFKLTGSDVFGRHCRIEQFRYVKPNEMHIYKVVSSIRTNTWCEVPYKEASKERWHDRMEDCILAIRCGIDETKVQRFRIADVEFMPRKECDRDALLELADELDRVGYNDWMYNDKWQPEEIARRIREAVNACEGDSDAPRTGDGELGGVDAYYNDCDVNTKTGKAIIGNAFWCKERTCRMVQSADFDLLVCDECHRIEEKNLLFAPGGKIEFDGKYCPGCGAKVIQ